MTDSGVRRKISKTTDAHNRASARPLAARGGFFRRWLVLALAAAILLAGSIGTAQAQRRKGKPTSPVNDFQSRHFLIHTDLTPKEADKLLKELETMLGLISTYWGRPTSGVLECYIVKDLKAWPAEMLAKFEPIGLAQIRDEVGVCVSQRLTDGETFVAKSIVYSTSKDGVPQHEAVHAYCNQTFGRTGPKWYAEGMAELGQYWINGKKGVNADPLAIEYLNSRKPKSLAQLIITDSVLGGSWQDYCCWWSLCHMLENNPNYTKDFRILGNGILSGNGLSFEKVFAPKAQDEIGRASCRERV